MRARDRGAAVCAIAAAAIAVLAIGGAPRWAQASVALLAAIALIPQLGSRQTFVKRSSLIVVIGIAAILTALQLVPLPSAVIAALDPTGAALREDGAQLVEASPWQAITLDAPGTLRALAFLLILLAIAVVASRVSASERGRYRVLAAIGALLAFTALVVGGHALFGATRLYGVYELRHATPYVIGPLLNENHLGGLMAVGAVLSIGLAMYPRQPTAVRVAWVGAVIACGAATAATSSRGATLALIAGAIVTAGILFAQRLAGASTARGRGSRFTTNSLPIGVVAVCTVVVMIYSSAGRVEQQLSATSLQEIQHPRSKFAAWRASETLIAESPWVGIGRGAFESTFSRVNPASGSVTFSHVENEYLQAAIDWGVPGAFLLGLALVWVAIVAMRRWSNGPLAAGALGGITVIAIQSTVDFGAEMLGVAVPLTAIAATLTYPQLHEASPRALAMSRALRIALIAALFASVALLLGRATTTNDEDHTRIAGSSPDLAAIREVVSRHPLDYYGYEQAATAMLRSGDRHAVHVLNHAMTLSPNHPWLHHVAARLLFHAGHVDQAAVEYAAALRSTPTPRQLVYEIVFTLPRELAVAAIPTDFDDPAELLKMFEALRRIDLSTAWLGRVLDAHPNDLRMCELLHGQILQHGSLAAAELSERRCTAIVPDRHTRLALARVVIHNRGYAEAIKLLDDVERWEGRIDEKVDAWFTVCDAHIALADWSAAERCLHRLDASGLVAPQNSAALTSRLEQVRKARAEVTTPGATATPAH